MSTPEDRLLFRFGYVCHAAADALKGDTLWSGISRSWRKTKFSELVIVSHPETQVAIASDAGGMTALVGDAFFTAGDLARSPLGCLSTARDSELLDLLDQLSGCFMLLAVRDGKASVYHDAFGSRSVFYRREGAFGLASHPELFEHTFGDRRWPEMMDFVNARWFRTMSPAFLPTDATLYEGIYALLPNHRYDVGRRRMERYWPRQKRKHGGTFEEFFSTFDVYFHGMAQHLRDRQIILSVTGGIDSRTLIAALKHYRVPFRTVTWTTFNFAEWEREPVDQIVQYLDGDHSWLDGTVDSINDEALIGARNSGNYRRPSRAVAGTARLFGRLRKALWLPGQGAAVIRGLPPPRDCLKEFSPPAVFKFYRRKPDPARPFKHDDFILREIEAMIARADFDVPVRLGYDPDDVYYWEHRVGTWSVCSINAMHSAVDSAFGFNTRPVTDAAMGLPEGSRGTKKLFLEVIRRYDSRLAEISYR